MEFDINKLINAFIFDLNNWLIDSRFNDDELNDWLQDQWESLVENKLPSGVILENKKVWR